MPQLVVSLTNPNDLIELVTKVTSLNNVTFKVNHSDTGNIFSKDSDSYKAILNHLDNIGIKFHTY